MPSRAKTPTRSSRKAAKAAKDAEKPAVDVNDPNIGGALAVAVVAVVGVALGGSMPTTLAGALSVLTLGGLNAAPLHAKWWPFSLLVTLHVLNSVKSNRKWWLNDVLNCCFKAFGGLLIQDALKGDFTLPSLFANGEANFSLVLACWYLVNHNIPMTDFNLYSTVTGALGQFLPLVQVMNLCTLVFNAQVLIAVASKGSTTSGWALFPFAFGSTMLYSTMVHCAGQFYSAKGLNLNVGTACSAKAHEAALVALWFGTNGLAALPFVGETLAIATGATETFFGGRHAFVLTVFVLNALVGHLVPLSLDVVYDNVHDILGVRQR